MLPEFSRPRGGVPPGGRAATLVELLRRRAAERPEAPAYLFLADGEREAESLTWGDLDRRARALAVALAETARPGERALLLFAPGLDFVAAFFSCLYAGVVAVPAYPPRSRRGLPRLAAVAADAGARVALTTSDLAERFAALSGAIEGSSGLSWLAADRVPVEAAGGWCEPGVGPESLAFLQYTSGSTATPKGVMVSHHNLLHNEELIRRAFGQDASAVVVGWLPLYHDMGLIGNVLQPLYAGGRCILMSPLDFLQRPRRWLEAIDRYRATTSGGPNFAYELCVEKVAPEERVGLDLSCWEVAFNGAEPVRAATLDRFAEAYAPQGFRRAAFLPCYGLAEATLFVTGADRERPPTEIAFDAASLEQGHALPAGAGCKARPLVGCGRAAADLRVEVVDPATGRVLPAGEVGEVWIAGPSVAGGYWRNEEATATTFAARLAGESDGPAFLRTGDLGFLAAGELFITGRVKDLIIVRGRNHYPQDLERTVEEAHPALRKGCGAAFSIEDGGEEGLVVVQEVERTARDLDPEAVAAAIRQAVAEVHELEVAALSLVKPGQVPKTSSGKIRRRACRELFLARDLEEVHRSTPVAEVVPAPGVPPPERAALAAAGAETRRDLLAPYLAAEARRALRGVMPRDDAPLALDSLAAMELKARVESALGVALPLEALLEAPSFAELVGLAARAVGEPGREQGAVDSAPRFLPGAASTAAHEPSHGQRALWFLQRLAPSSAAYQIRLAAALPADVDLDTVAQALAFVATRHPALTSVFVPGPDGPMVRTDGPPPAWSVVDAADASELAGRLADEASRPFDLERGPVARATVFLRQEAGQASGSSLHPALPLLLLTVHHLVADLTSLSLVAEELGQVYASLCRGTSVRPAGSVATDADFAAWQRAFLDSPEGDEQWRWWRERLAGELPDLELPTDRPRPPLPTHQGAARVVRLDPGPAEGLRRVAAGEGATPFAALLGIFQVLLARTSGQSRVVVGSPASGRSRPGLEGVVGYLVNPLPFLADLGADPTFAELVRSSRSAVAGGLARQDLPFPLLVERLAPRRDPGRSPIFQAFFAFERLRHLAGPAEAAADLSGFVLGRAGSCVEVGGPEGLRLTSVDVDDRWVQFDLELTLVDEGPGRGLAGSLRYATDLFDATTAERLSRRLAVLAADAAETPERRIGELPLIAAGERHQLLVEWNDSASAVPRRTLPGAVAAVAGEVPDRIAIDGPGGQVSYGELVRRAERFAVALATRGVGPGDRVAIAVERTVDLLVALLGVLRAGAVYLPLDPAYPRERLAYMASDARVAAVVADAASAAALPPLAVPRIDLDGPWGAAGVAPAVPENPEAPAYVLYTSGSTGRPKGVVVSHGALLNFLAAMAAAPGLAEAGALLAVTSLSFDISALELYLPLLVGARIELAGRAEATDGRRLAARIAECRPSALQATPATWRLLLEGGWTGAPNLTALSGGEALPGDLAGELARRTAAVWNLYGPTETTVWSARQRVTSEAVALVPIGRPIENTGLYVLDRRGCPVPGDVLGELWIGGDGVAHGYLGRPSLTAERFLPDPFAVALGVGGPGGTGARMYRTGDLVRRRRDGVLEFLGRIDHQVKVRGHRIELGEIEAVLSRHPQVRQAVVVAREEGAGDVRLAAYLVPEGDDPTVEELRAYAATRLPDAMRPSFLIVLDGLPMTPNGKVDRKALAGPAYAPERPVAAAAAPQGEVELKVAAVWREVLGAERVGAEDNFFDLGGHSLLLSRVQARLAADFGADFSLVDLFRLPTVRAQADALRGVAGPGLAQGRGRERAAARSRAARGALGDGNRLADGAIAIVGMACRVPGASDLESFWANLAAGVESVRDLTEEELAAAGVSPREAADPRYVRRAGVLDEADRFDAAHFDVAPREAELLDPQQRVFLEVAVAALEDAGIDPARHLGAIGVFAGAGMNAYLVHQLAAGRPPADPALAYQWMICNDKDFLATRVAYKLDLTGPAVAVQTACSTSLVAVHLACQSLLVGECDAALAGGVSIAVPPTAGYLYQEGMILAPDGRCRPFSDAARGTVRGSGAGVVVLRRLAEALAAGDSIRAVVRGSAINNDGARKVGYTAPSAERQAAVIAEALAVGGIEPSSIGYVEAHGTGTELGDPIEVAALAEVFAGGTADSVALGSVKANLGHLDAAAGVVGLIKAALAIERGEVPPQPDFGRPNPALGLEKTPFEVPRVARPWPAGPAPRRAGVSSFGIGGTNAHVVLEQAPAPREEEPGREWQILPLAARSDAALDALSGAIGRRLAALAAQESGGREAILADAAFTLATGRRAMGRRRTVVARDLAEAALLLCREEVEPQRVVEGQVDEGGAGRPVVFLFPGQGAQHPDMGRDLFEREPVFRETVDRAAAALAPSLGLDLRTLLYPDPGADPASAAARLTETRFAQPALFVVELALGRLWRSWGVEPSALIGHSVGELVAACLAGALTEDDALGLVAARGRLMQAMLPGAMLAAAVGPLEAEALAAEHGVSVAAFNAPDSSVLSGSEPAIAALAEALAGRGVAARRLVTSHAFHSSMMDPALAPFRSLAAGILSKGAGGAPMPAVVSTRTGGWLAAAEMGDPDHWTEQIRRPVRFAEALATALAAHPDAALLEVGPGRALTDLARRQSSDGPGTAPRPIAVSLGPAKGGAPELPRLLAALGRLWSSGVGVDWEAFHGGARRRRLSLPTYPFERRRFWVERGAVAPAVPRAADRVETLAKHADPERWFYMPSWRRVAPGPVDPTAVAGTLWWIFAPAGGLSEELAGRVRAAGGEAVLVRPGFGLERRAGGEWTVDPWRREDWAKLLSAAGTPAKLIHLEPLGAAGSGTDLDEGLLRPILRLSEALAGSRGGGRCDLLIVASQLVDVAGGEAVRPERAAVLGLAPVVAQETSRLACRVVDLGPDPGGSAAAERILAEASGEEPLVAWRGDRRWLPEFVPVPAAGGGGLQLRRGGVYLVTGGFGAVGGALTRRLAEGFGARLVLVGRSPLASRSEWPGLRAGDGEAAARIRRVEELEAGGAEVLAWPVDLAGPGAVAGLTAALAEARERWGAVHGVIHAAGPDVRAAARPLAGLHRSDFEAIAGPRLRGARALAEALAETATEVDFCLVVSSLSAVLGGLGFGAYAAVHAALDAFAAERRRAGEPWLTVDWEGWRPPDNSMPPGAAFDLALTDREGPLGLEPALARFAAGRLILSSGDLALRWERWVRRGGAPDDGSRAEPPPAHDRPALATPYVAPGGEVELGIAEVWRLALGVDRVGLHDNFFELGGTSLVGIQVVAEVNRRFGVDVPTVGLYEGPTVASLAGVVARLRGSDPRGGEGGDPAAATGGERGDRRRDLARQRREALRRPEGGAR